MFDFINEFEKNRRKIEKNQGFIHLNETLLEIRDFLYGLGFLSFGRDIHVLRRMGAVTGNGILDSVARTMESIRYCCLNANFADAYTLLRKYRDDLFFYLYISAYKSLGENSEQKKSMATQIAKWSKREI